MVGLVLFTHGGDFVKLKHMKKENGQAMVEFALVLPILLLFIGGIIDFGWIFHNQILVNNATREEARDIAIHYYTVKDDPDLETDTAANIKNKVGPVITSPSVSEIVAVPDGKEGYKVTVSFTGQMKVLTPILSTILGEEHTVKSVCTMRVENN